MTGEYIVFSNRQTQLESENYPSIHVYGFKKTKEDIEQAIIRGIEKLPSLILKEKPFLENDLLMVRQYPINGFENLIAEPVFAVVATYDGHRREITFTSGKTLKYDMKYEAHLVQRKDICNTVDRLGSIEFVSRIYAGLVIDPFKELNLEK